MHSRLKPLPRAWFKKSALELAPLLLGKVVRRGSCAGIIVETEAYAADPASHAARATPRSALMRSTFGRWYVYFTYGMHWCANVTADERDAGAVLIRAVEPLDGIALMKRRRKVSKSDFDTLRLCNGPAKFCEAFGISGKENGRALGDSFGIFYPPRDAGTIPAEPQIGVSPRIGIKNGTDLHWRFYIKNSPFVSRAR